MKIYLICSVRNADTQSVAEATAYVQELEAQGHVTADGKLSACCFDANANWTMGDLTKQTFMEAWHSSSFVALREAHLKRDVKGTVCEQCVAYSG